MVTIQDLQETYDRLEFTDENSKLKLTIDLLNDTKYNELNDMLNKYDGEIPFTNKLFSNFIDSLIKNLSITNEIYIKKFKLVCYLFLNTTKKSLEEKTLENETKLNKQTKAATQLQKIARRIAAQKKVKNLKKAANNSIAIRALTNAANIGVVSLKDQAEAQAAAATTAQSFLRKIAAKTQLKKLKEAAADNSIAIHALTDVANIGLLSLKDEAAAQAAAALQAQAAAAQAAAAQAAAAQAAAAQAALQAAHDAAALQALEDEHDKQILRQINDRVESAKILAAKATQAVTQAKIKQTPDTDPTNIIDNYKSSKQIHNFLINYTDTHILPLKNKLKKQQRLNSPISIIAKQVDIAEKAVSDILSIAGNYVMYINHLIGKSKTKTESYGSNTKEAAEAADAETRGIDIENLINKIIKDPNEKFKVPNLLENIDKQLQRAVAAERAAEERAATKLSLTATSLARGRFARIKAETIRVAKASATLIQGMGRRVAAKTQLQGLKAAAADNSIAIHALTDIANIGVVSLAQAAAEAAHAQAQAAAAAEAKKVTTVQSLARKKTAQKKYYESVKTLKSATEAAKKAKQDMIEAQAEQKAEQDRIEADLIRLAAEQAEKRELAAIKMQALTRGKIERSKQEKLKS